jgi:hypothetical protein
MCGLRGRVMLRRRHGPRKEGKHQIAGWRAPTIVQERATRRRAARTRPPPTVCRHWRIHPALPIYGMPCEWFGARRSPYGLR